MAKIRKKLVFTVLSGETLRLALLKKVYICVAKSCRITMRITVFLAAVLLLLPACRNKTVVDTRELASTVTDKACTIIHPGHYTGTCLYCGLADLEDPRLLPILQDLVDGKTQVDWASVHCYQVGGPAAAYLAWKGNEQLLAAVKENAAYMWQHQYRTTDGLMTGNIQKERFRDGVWIDLVFSITPYMLYAGLATGNQEYIDYAAWYALSMYKLLKDPATGLVLQARAMGPLEQGEISTGNWSRGQGWLSMGLSALLRDYPKDGSRREEIETLAREYYTAVLKYQDEDGMWHQNVSDWNTFVETSGSALLLAGIGQAIQSGVLPEERTYDFMRGLRGLMAYVDPDGSVGHTCQGTLVPGQARKEDYAFRHFYFNDHHAFGPVVLALAQARRMGVKRFSLDYPLGYKNEQDRPRTYVAYKEKRKGDIAWENDLSAYRIYSRQIGQDSYSWSGVDMLCKSVDYAVIDKWYSLLEAGISYHSDHGEGCDFYTVGANRGTGGTGVWADGRLWTSQVYDGYEILRNDPARIAFTLTYDPYEAGAVTITEKKQIDFVLGTPFYRIQSTLESSDGSDIVYAVGITEFGNGAIIEEPAQGKFFVAEHIAAPKVHPNGLLEWAPETEIFGAAFADPNQVEGIVRSGKDVLLLVRVPSGSEVTVYTGALWDQQFVECSHLAWEGYAKDLFAQTDWNKLNERYQ